MTSKIADVFLMLYGRLKTRVKHTDNTKNYWRVGFLLSNGPDKKERTKTQ